MRRPVGKLAQTRGGQDKSVGARRPLLQEAELAVVHLRVLRQLGQVAAQQRQQVLFVDAAQLTHAVNGRAVFQVTGQHIAGIGGQRHQRASLELLGHLADESGLRIDGMDLDAFHVGPLGRP